jgi:hypothetical protein
MEWALSEADQAEEMGRAFETVGKQFVLFLDAMRRAGLPEPVAQALTVKYGEVVCELLYLDGSDGCDGG